MNPSTHLCPARMAALFLRLVDVVLEALEAKVVLADRLHGKKWGMRWVRRDLRGRSPAATAPRTHRDGPITELVADGALQRASQLILRL